MKKYLLPLIFAAIISCNSQEQCNLALNRAAVASSNYDFNLTAQLLTDGLLTDGEPAYLEVLSSEGEVARVEREASLDKDIHSRNPIQGSEGWLEYRFHGYEVKADKAVVVCQQALPGGHGGTPFTLEVPVTTLADGGLRIALSLPYEARWRVKEVNFFDNGVAVENILPSAHFTSAWMSAGSDSEWVMVDLGEIHRISGVCVAWLSRPETASVELSCDGENWKTVKVLADEDFSNDCVACCGRGRFVRVSMDGVHDENARYMCISELEVYGNARRQAPSDWVIKRAPEVDANGEEISSNTYDANGWLPAVVPGTVLNSYIKAGAVPDPDYADNIANISDSYFNSDFWYRRVFDASEYLSEIAAGRRAFLDFDGINWKAEVYLNGQHVDDIEGGFIRGHMDITELLCEGDNVLAVKIIHNAHQGCVKEKTVKWTGYNGGVLGYDSPTFLASIGWDWITTVRGRNMGIWNDVRIVTKGMAEVADPLVVTSLDEDGHASMTATVVVRDASSESDEVEVEGWIGDIRFSKKIDGSGEVSFTPEEFPQLADQQMELWWPNEYGEPNLYDAGYIIKVNGAEADRIEYKAGIREVTWDTEGGALRLYVNGRRLDAMGGNWGFSQHNLDYTAEQYDIAVAYHKQMHFNMIRNWVGQIGDEEFYDACDRYGITIWQDFWLANPADGPDPLDEDMFLRNAEDLVAKIRRHPSLVLYCGRNEGVPPASLDVPLKTQVVPNLHPAMPYISDSGAGVVSGHGPYWMEPAEYYFKNQSGKLHSERGMPNMPTIESLGRMMPQECFWPFNDMWGKHDFTLEGAQRAATYFKIFEETFGEAADAREFTALAQWFNYEGYRAMFESENSKDRMGLLLWMSHSCWPSMVWCTYDYYYEPTGAFFGCKKACEPLHIQYNAASGNVELVNICSGDQIGLQALCRVYGLKGNLLSEQSECYDLADDSSLECFPVAKPEGEETYYIVLSLTDAAGNVVSDNYYMKGDLKAARSLPAAKISKTVAVKGSSDGNCNEASVVLRNDSDVPALLVRLILKDGKGAEILPVDYSDNYLALMPGAEKTVTIRWNGASKVVVDVTQLAEL